MTPLRVLIVDDHPIFRDGLRTALQTDTIELVGEAANGTGAIELADKTVPDVVLNRPGFDGGSGYWIPTPSGSVCWAA